MLEQGLHETIVESFEVEVTAVMTLEEEIAVKMSRCTIVDEEMIDIRRLCGNYLYDTLLAPDNIELENIEKDFEKATAHEPSFQGRLVKGDHKVTSQSIS